MSKTRQRYDEEFKLAVGVRGTPGFLSALCNERQG